MKTGVWLCTCGGNLAERIDFARLKLELERLPGVAFVKEQAFLCAEEGRHMLEADLLETRPDRVVIAACTPREYEGAFMQVLSRVGINPYFLQVVNIREQVAWVTPDGDAATGKALAQIRGALARVRLHQPLDRKEIDICRDVLVIGAGPAGLKAALTLAEAGRNVCLVEKSPALGGMPVRYEDLFPAMECAPCLLEPVLGEVLHGTHAERVEVMTMAEVVDVAGYYGNFTVQVRQAARHVDVEACIGCAECVAPCPATTPNEFNYALDERKAMAIPFAGALPNAPFLDATACVRARGDDCTLCQAACPVEGAIRFDDMERTVERKVGAIVVAVGAGLYDCRRLPQLGYRSVPDVCTSAEFERMLASNGPLDGELRLRAGNPPESVAIVHCVGSLDGEHRPYCSGVCCQYAFKFNHLIAKKLPGARVYHLYRELSMPGKEAFALYNHARHNPDATFARYRSLAGMSVSGANGGATIEYEDESGERRSIAADMVVLCPAVTGAEGTPKLSRILDAPLDDFGFFEELHGRLDAAQSRIRGIFLAGACQAPMDIAGSISQGMAAAGYILSGLAEGRKLEIEPITASVDEERCSRCHTCARVCPYKAISYPPERNSAVVNALLCHGCGTCVAACPAGAIRGNHFTDGQILAEIEAVLQ